MSTRNASQISEAPVSVIIPAFGRPGLLDRVLAHLDDPLIREVIVFDNSANGSATPIAARHPRVRLMSEQGNLGVAARNRAVSASSGELLLFLDDDSYPLPGAIKTLVEAIDRDRTIGIIGGLVRDRNKHGQPLPPNALGSFDWWLRLGADGAPPPTGFVTTGFSEGACIARREAFVQAGGWFEPYFWQGAEIDLAIRLIAAGWDVRYLPTAEFEHEKAERSDFAPFLYHQQRNRIWFYWRHFPALLAARRIVGYLLLDLLESIHRRTPRTTWLAIRDSWRLRSRVSGTRRPLPRAVIRRAELQAGRMHLRLLLAFAGHSARAAFARALPSNRSARSAR